MRLLLQSCLLLISTTTFGQSVSRESAPLPTLSAPIHNISKITGWTFTDEKEWVQRENRLPYRSASENRYSHDRYADGHQNLKALQTRIVTINGERLFLILKYVRAGHFTYPNLKQDWRRYDAIEWYAFDLSIAKSIASITVDHVARQIDTKTKYSGQIDDFLDPLSVERLVRDIQASTSGKKFESHRGENLLIRLFPVTDQGSEVMRFRIIESGLASIYGEFKPEVFDETYYEVPFAEFRKLFTGVE